MKTLIAAVLMVIGISSAGYAETAVREEETPPAAAPSLTTAEGIQFALPEDWPVVKRGGGVGPAPIEEYLAIKFGKIDARLKAVEERLAAMEKKPEETEVRHKGPRFISGVSDEPNT